MALTDEDLQKIRETFGRDMERYSKSTNVATSSTNAYSAALAKGLPGLGKFAGGMTDLAKAAINGNEQLTSYTNALGNAGSAIPGFEKLVKGGGGILAAFIDETGAAFKRLSDAGIRTAGGMSDVAKLSAQAGIQTDKFARFISDNEKTFRTMGSSGGNAAKAFAEMSYSFTTDTENYSQGLRQLGYGTEEINEALVGFAAINRAQYLENLKTGQSQNKAAFKFATELDRMSQLTGENRKQLMKEMDAKRRDGRVQAFLRSQTGEMGAEILKTSTMLGKMDKGAQALVEDILIQGSATKESAAAAAFYGKGVTDAAQEMRAAQKAGDTEAYAKAQQKLIVEMTKAQNDQEKIRTAQYRVSGGYIQAQQGMIGEFTEFNDRIKAKAAEMGLDVNNADDLGKAAAELLKAGEINQKASGIIDGKVQNGADVMTSSYAAATDAISQTSRVIKDELADGARIAANRLGVDLPQSINNASKKMMEIVVSNAEPFKEAMMSDIANIDSGLRISGTKGVDVNAMQGATSQQGFTMENNETLTSKLVSELQELNKVLGKLVNAINPKANGFGGPAFSDMLNLVGDMGPEFITPNANSLVVTAKQMADKMRPQMENMASQMQPEMESIAENMKANAPKIATNRGSKEVDFEMLFNGQSQQVAQTNKLLEQVVRAIKKNGGDLQLV